MPTPHPDEVAPASGGAGSVAQVAANQQLGVGPQVMLRGAFGPQHEADAKVQLFSTLMDVRMSHPSGDGRLDAAWIATVVGVGWKTFRRMFVRDCQAAARVDPQICGRIDPSEACMVAWQMCHRYLREFVEQDVGPRMRGGLKYKGERGGPGQVLELYARYYKPPAAYEKPIPIEEEIVRLKSITTAENGMRGSAIERRGTIRELANDIIDPVAREGTHKVIDRFVEQEKVRDAKYGG